jgi:hypothetical protein
VRTINYSITLKAIDEGGSMLVMTYPILNATKIHATSRRNAIVDQVFDGVSTDSYLAPAIVYNYSAAQTAIGLALNGAGQPVRGAFTIPDDYFEDGPVRMIGMGVEVRDVSNDLHKQGTLTCFEVPQSIGETENITIRAQSVTRDAVETDYIQTSVNAVPINKFPDNLGEMMLYPSTLQWACEDGCYTVVPYSGRDNYAVESEYRTPWMYGTESDNDKPGTLNTTSKFIGEWASGSPDGDNFVFLANNYAPVHSKGIYLSGLGAESEITFNFRMFLECFPTASSKLSTLAKRSAKFDPAALALISAAMKKLPVGVPVGNNLSGDWFWQTLEAALPYIGGIASVVFPEFSPFIAAGTAAGVGALRLRKQPKKKTKPLPPIPQQRAAAVRRKPLPPVPAKRK